MSRTAARISIYESLELRVRPAQRWPHSHLVRDSRAGMGSASSAQGATGFSLRRLLQQNRHLATAP
jgi:hypothetical protein